MSKPIAIDLTRLLLAPISRTPRGIDRVELGYARHFFGNWPDKCVGIFPTPFGARFVGRRRALRLIDSVERLWKEEKAPNADPSYRFVRKRLLGEPATAPSARHTVADIAGGFGRLVAGVGLSPGRSAMAKLLPGTVYINTGQLGLAVPSLLSWIRARPDIKPLFMLHDVIPLEHAEYVSPSARGFHGQMIASAALHAAGLVTTTQAASEAVLSTVTQAGRMHIPTRPIPLPVSDVFLDANCDDPALKEQTYFVCCGSIEPRKNHILLLNIWRALARKMGRKTPKLVIVGARHRTDNATIDMLERCAPIQPHVIEVAGLSSPSLRRLFQNARAVLMPSFAEGFGLPIIEALSCKTPVLASDIAAHLEAGRGYARFLSPLDGAAWLEAIQALAEDNDLAAAQRQRLAPYRPWTWDDYFHTLEPFIDTLTARTMPIRLPKGPLTGRQETVEI